MTRFRSLGEGFAPETGDVVEDTSSGANAKVAAAVATYKEIFLPYPRHVTFHSDCDYLRQLGLATKGGPQSGLRVLAPSGSGKSTAARMFIALLETRERSDPDVKPVVMVSLTSAATPKKLFSDILTEMGDGFADRGTEQTLRRRVIACFEQFQTQLLIIDEVQHLNFRSSAKNDVTDALKSLLDTGVVPIVFLGTEDAEAMFKRNLQLNGRLLPPCDFKPLRATVAEDAELFSGFWQRLDAEVVKRGLMRSASGLDGAEFLGALHKVTGGVVGTVSRLAKEAMTIAIRRSAERIELYDFVLATDRWAIPNSFCSTNPFRSLLR